MTNNTTQRAAVDTIANMQRLYRGHWFDKDTMRFFKSRTSDYTARIGTAYYFISSEKHADDPRRYTIRKFDSTDPTSIETVGEFQQYATLRAAEKALYKIANW